VENMMIDSHFLEYFAVWINKCLPTS